MSWNQTNSNQTIRESFLFFLFLFVFFLDLIDFYYKTESVCF